MKEHPILFQTEMVQAIMDLRKTQTRRVVSSGNTIDFSIEKKFLDFDHVYPNGNLGVKVKKRHFDTLWRGRCKYQPGDLLYVRETFGYEFEGEPDDEHEVLPLKLVFKTDPNATPVEWKPSIFLPKEKSRLWLKVKDVWPEKLSEISCDDILDEGVGIPQQTECHELRKMWIELWDSINKEKGHGWEKNPVVWAVEFELISDTGRPAV